MYPLIKKNMGIRNVTNSWLMNESFILKPNVKTCANTTIIIVNPLRASI